jgi:hypothetical protein
MVVEHLTNDPEIMGSNPHMAWHQEKMQRKKFHGMACSVSTLISKQMILKTSIQIQLPLGTRR